MRKSLVAAALLAVWIVTGCYEKEQAAPIIDEAVDVINQHGVIVKNRGKLDAFIDQTEGMQRIELRPKVTFDLELRFGVNQRNVINTKERTVVKDLQNGETAVIRDFEFTDKENQSIYKALVLAGYQEDKSLTTACNKKPHESFDLTVKVANGSYHYAWSECDKSEDGKRMTMLVEDIVGKLEKREEYKRLPAVQGYYE